MARSANSNNDAGVTQLEFHQAMRDFKTMFPDMDEEVIEYVLRSNNGAVDSTIDQLLLMASDSEKEKSRTANAIPTTTNTTTNITTATAGHSDNVLSVDDLFFGVEQPSTVATSLPSYAASAATAATTTTTTTTRSVAGDEMLRPLHNQLINLSEETDHSPSYLNPPSYQSASNAQSASLNETPQGQPQTKLKDCNLSASNQVNSASLFSSSKCNSTNEPRFSHLSYSVYDTTGILSQKVSNTSLRARFKWIPPILGKLPDSFLRVQVTNGAYNAGRSSHGASSQRFHHQSSQAQSSRTRAGGSLTSAPSSGNASNFISSAMLAQKMEENERRRQQAIEDEDEEVARYLEDERFAILLQNAEFVHELRHNQEFMSQLEMDNKRRRQEGHMQFGSGSNYNSSTGPSSLNISDAAFKEALKNMGKKSKKKFAQLAGVFKKKKGNLFNEGIGHGLTGIDVTSSPHRQSRDFLLDDSYKEFENEYSSDSERDRNSPYWERDPRTGSNPQAANSSSSRISTSSNLHNSQQNRH